MENRILQERNDLRIALAESEAKVAELANERDEAVQLKVYWNALLNQCGAAVNMRAGDAMDSVPECVRSCVAEREAENEQLRTRFDALGVAHRRNADQHVKDVRELEKENTRLRRRLGIDLSTNEEDEATVEALLQRRSEKGKSNENSSSEA